MDLTIILIFVSLAIAVFAVITGFEQRGAKARALRERLVAVDTATKRNPSEELQLLRDELLSTIPALNRLLSRYQYMRKVQDWLSQADMNMRAGRFVLLCASFGAACALVATLLINNALFLLIGGAVGVNCPVLFASVKRSKRFRLIEAQLPDAIDVLARAVRAGHSFNTSLELIAGEMAEPIAGEFRKLFEEQKFGLPMRDALLNLADRLPLSDVRMFVVAVLVQRDTGGNLAEILDKLSYVIRERFKILRQVRVYTAQGRLTMGILMALPFVCALAMTFIAPDFIRLLFTDPLGVKFIATGFVMLTIGFFLIRKIIHIKV